jgi:pilus assembly protein Flp/PilA
MARCFGPDTKMYNKPIFKGHIMKNLITRFQNNESGATAIEYGLIAALISVAIIVSVTAVGTNLGTTFTDIAAELL